MQPIKTLKFDNDVIDVLRTLDVRADNGHFIGVLNCGQLERRLYDRTNKALETMGGKWNRKAGGHVFDDDPRDQLAQLLGNGNLTVVRDGFFRTPHTIVEYMVSKIGINGSILEPSAGDGAIADVLVECGADKRLIQCVELNGKRAEVLRSKGYLVHNYDFMNFMPIEQRFDRVFMNPPFENGQDIDHVMHAYGLLADGGALASVMSEGAFFREDNKAATFREWLVMHAGYSFGLPPDSFAKSGTGVNARLVFMNRFYIYSRPVGQLELFT